MMSMVYVYTHIPAQLFSAWKGVETKSTPHNSIVSKVIF
jgi:hypothetical protein